MEAYNYVLPTPEDVRAARSYMGWSQEELSRRAGLGKRAIYNIEKRTSKPSFEILQSIRDVFLAEGIIFNPSGGFQANQNVFRILLGSEGVKEFCDDVYHTMKDKGGLICISGVNEEDFVTARYKAGVNSEEYRLKMSLIPNLKYKVIVAENDPNAFGAKHIEYRGMSEKDFSSAVPFFLYGDKLAIIFWDIPKIMILQDERLAKAYEAQFNLLWERAQPLNNN